MVLNCIHAVFIYNPLIHFWA